MCGHLGSAWAASSGPRGSARTGLLRRPGGFRESLDDGVSFVAGAAAGRGRKDPPPRRAASISMAGRWPAILTTSTTRPAWPTDGGMVGHAVSGRPIADSRFPTVQSETMSSAFPGVPGIPKKIRSCS